MVALLAALLIASPSLATPSGTDTEVTFDVAATRATVGRVRAIPFHAPASDTDRTLDVEVSDTQILQVVDKPTLLAGYATGFLRVRAIKPGATTLTIGNAKIKVEVTQAHTIELEPEAAIIEPANGAVVWGAFTVGVEAEDVSGAGDGTSEPRVTLKLSTGQKIEPAGITPRSLGPTRRIYFKVDATDLPAGPLDISLSGSAAEENLIEGQRVRVRHQARGIGGYEDRGRGALYRRAALNGSNGPRSRSATTRLRPAASLSTTRAQTRAACLAFHVEQAGWYQAALVAAGDFGGGAFPSVGLVIDNGQYPATNVRLCTGEWHRLALGIPVKLEAGDRVLTPYFMNDFAAGRQSDRNLRLDYIELVRVDGPSGSAGLDGGDDGPGDGPHGAHEPHRPHNSLYGHGRSGRCDGVDGDDGGVG